MAKPRIYPPRESTNLPNARDLSEDSEEEFLNVYASLDSLEESDNDVKSIILDQLRRYRHVNIRIKKSNKGDGRYAILTFDNLDALNYFKRAILEKRDRIIVYDKVLFFNFNHAQQNSSSVHQRLSSSITARDQLQETFVGRKRLKIGFGKVTPSHALWVGGLNENTTEEEITTEVKRNSRFASYEFLKDENMAYFVFETIEDSRRAYNGLQNTKLVHSGAKIELYSRQVDYADTHNEAKELMDKVRVKDSRKASRSSSRSPENTALSRVRNRSRSLLDSSIKVNRKRRHSYSSSSCSSHRRSPIRNSTLFVNPHDTQNDSDLKSLDLHKSEIVKERKKINPGRSTLIRSGGNELSLIAVAQKSNSLIPATSNLTFNQILNVYPVVWKGGMAVKTNITFLQLHLICGCVDPVSTMVHQVTLTGRDATVISLTKRFPLLPDRVTDLRNKLASAIASRDCCILIAQPTSMDSREAVGMSAKPIEHLISYFQQKQAAGIGSVGGLSVYAFPPSPFTLEQLTTLMPHAVTCLTASNNDYIMLIDQIRQHSFDK
ncbi:hypothetical protein MXB_3698 [Myxobolus squamalis]|nr:hypothetical protein MXB_3698 [Myxobolus squamalis]